MARRALCIGINDYPGISSDLAGCVNDARDWAAALDERGFAVEVLLDGDATREAMLTGMSRLVGEARTGDLVVFQFSGHGSWIPDRDGDELDGRDEVLCPHDIGRNRPLSDDDLHDIFSERERGSRIVLISDSCHSGTVSRFAPGRPPPEKASRVRYLPPAAFLDEGAVQACSARDVSRAASPPGRHASLLLAGCRESEFSYDATFDGRPNGAFTHAALAALAGLPEGATYRDWYLRIRAALPTSEHPQTPILAGTYRQVRWPVLE